MPGQERPNGTFASRLTDLDDHGLVASVIAKAIGVPRVADQPVLTTLAEHLRSRRTLLLVGFADNEVVNVLARLVEASLFDRPSENDPRGMRCCRPWGSTHSNSCVPPARYTPYANDMRSSTRRWSSRRAASQPSHRCHACCHQVVALTNELLEPGLHPEGGSAPHTGRRGPLAGTPRCRAPEPAGRPRPRRTAGRLVARV
jgi:hypothetical protein